MVVLPWWFSEVLMRCTDFEVSKSRVIISSADSQPWWWHGSSLKSLSQSWCGFTRLSGKKQLLFSMNTVTCFSLKKIKFPDQVLLSLLVKTIMGHKTLLFFHFFSLCFEPLKCQSYAFQEHLCRTVLSEVKEISVLAEALWHLIFPGETGSWGLLHKRS